MRLILGLDRPSAGSVTIDGKPFARLYSADARGRRACWTRRPCTAAAAPTTTCAAWRATNGIPRRRVDEVIGLVGLEEVARKRSKGFSLGMSQRLGIAAALLGDPEILMFDEPVNGLDPEGIRWIRLLMRSLAAEGRTVFVSSHLMSEMENTADHLIVIGRGKLIADCPMAEFTAGGRRWPREDARTPAAGRRGTAVSGPAELSRRGGELEVRGLDVADVGEIAHHNSILLQLLAPARASLEEAFMELTADSVEFHATTEA